MQLGEKVLSKFFYFSILLSVNWAGGKFLLSQYGFQANLLNNSVQLFCGRMAAELKNLAHVFCDNKP